MVTGSGNGVRRAARILFFCLLLLALPLSASGEGWSGFSGTTSDVLKSTEYHTVRFLLDGKETAVVFVPVDEALGELPAAPDKAGYDFAWYLDGAPVEASFVPAGDVELTGRYTLRETDLSGYWTVQPGASLPSYETPDAEGNDSLPITNVSAFRILSLSDDWAQIRMEGETRYVNTESLLALREMERDESKIQRNRRAAIQTDFSGAVAVGETLRLTAVLEGFEDCSQVIVVWEADKGAGWEEVGQGSEFAYTADADSIRWRFRVRVEYQL